MEAWQSSREYKEAWDSYYLRMADKLNSPERFSESQEFRNARIKYLKRLNPGGWPQDK